MSELADDYSVAEAAPFFSGFPCFSSATLDFIKIFYFFLPNEKEILILCNFFFSMKYDGEINLAACYLVIPEEVSTGSRSVQGICLAVLGEDEGQSFQHHVAV